MSEQRRDYLEVRGIRVEFDGFVAVDGVDLTLLQGQVHFLIGPNGAGKTTVVDALTGLVKASGLASYDHHNLLEMSSHGIVRLGIGRTFQTATVFEELTVVQNLDIAGGVHRRAWSMLRPRRGVPDYVHTALETVGLTDLADRPAGVLSHGQKQWLEIGMLLVQDAKVMLLDEPVAGMSSEERAQTGELLHRIGKERTIVVIEHDMEFVRAYADVVTVMSAGTVLAHGSVEEIRANPEVQRVYLGHTVEGAA
jgi:urea transport system ATP-binding protein